MQISAFLEEKKTPFSIKCAAVKYFATVWRILGKRNKVDENWKQFARPTSST